MRRLCHCELSERLLYSCFLLLMGLGYLMALGYLYATYQGVDGKPGLSVQDIAENYYGNRSGSRLEAAIRGSMAAYLPLEERYPIVAWLKSGAPEAEFEQKVLPIVQKRCAACHGPQAGPGLPDLTHYDGIREVADIDTGVSLQTLVKISHIHLFGVGLVLLGVGMIFRRAQLREPLKSLIIVLPYAAIVADILAWFLTKWDPVYAYTVVVAGAVLGLCLGLQILISLYQMWFVRAGSEACPSDG